MDAGRPLGIDKEWPAKFLIPLMETHPGMQVVLSSDCVDDCRACKDAEEQTLMREASRINDAVNEAAKHYIKARADRTRGPRVYARSSVPTAARGRALRRSSPLVPTPPTRTPSRTTPC